ncbi:MAG: Gfo/Idh/MocA family oxidoreductase, partial [Armatimonadetes bacterium]|nr:Gfo/Idh/MocA family oxidoreductase [Armatimonadota bacterium]
MTGSDTGRVSRRELLQGAGSALTMAAVPYVHVAQDNTIRLALIGCGGRGSGAVGDAMSVQGAPVKLVAMADIFADRVNGSYDGLKRSFGDRVDVPEDRRFVGYDAYTKAMDCLKPGDVAIMATPPAFRWVHFRQAIAKGLNAFMEKPVTVDGPTSKRMLALGEESVAKGLKVGIGLMCRHCVARKALFEQIKAGAMGEIMLLRGYRMHDQIGYFASGPKPADMSEMLYQTQRFHSFLWSGGGAYSDFYIHHIDECCWMKDAWPVQAHALGGRHYREGSVDQNFDAYSVEYTFADGTKLYLEGRCIRGCQNAFASYAHGTKGLAIVSENGHAPARCRIFKGHLKDPNAVAWSFAEREPSPYQLEWADLLGAIRGNKPYNEVKR